MLIGRHITMSGFEPSGYEVEFGDREDILRSLIELPDGSLVKMTGRIDRIDSMTEEEPILESLITNRETGR